MTYKSMFTVLVVDSRITHSRSLGDAFRVAATMALVYPPGIGVMVPGERWDDRTAPMIA
jgi:ornithine decarboxylase